MPSDDRHRLSREDIGILLSYATHPDKLTDGLVERLRRGVTRSELDEIAAHVGLPKSTAARIIEANRPGSQAKNQHISGLPQEYRRALIGLLAVFVLSDAIFKFASDQSPITALVLIAAGALTAYFVYSLIVRFAAR